MLVLSERTYSSIASILNLNARLSSSRLLLSLFRFIAIVGGSAFKAGAFFRIEALEWFLVKEEDGVSSDGPLNEGVFEVFLNHSEFLKSSNVGSRDGCFCEISAKVNAKDICKHFLAFILENRVFFPVHCYFNYYYTLNRP